MTNRKSSGREMVRWPALQIQIQKVLGLNLGLETKTEGFLTTHQFLQANVRTIAQIRIVWIHF
jgi:hypothetical protein